VEKLLPASILLASWERSVVKAHLRPRQVGSPPAVDKRASLESSSEDGKLVPKMAEGSPTVDESTKTPDSEKGEQGKPRHFKVPWSPSVRFSSPLPDAPKVCWRNGSNPEIIIEMWPDAEAQPSQRFRAFLEGEFRRIVIYNRNSPHIRAVFELGELRTGGRQEIIGGHVEWDGLVTKKELRGTADLLEEFAKIDERGRPAGSRRPKRKPHEVVGLTAKSYLKLERSGLTRKQIRALTLWACGTSQVEIGRQLGILAQAVWRLLKRAERNLKAKNPNFSLSTLNPPEQAGTGQRRNKRPMERDKSGTPYMRDSKQMLG